MRIRDAFRRAGTPELFVRLSLTRGDTAQIEFGFQDELSKPITLSASIGNRATQPAFHTQVLI